MLSIKKFYSAGLLLDIKKYCLILVSFIMVFANAKAQDGIWTTKADMPTTRGMHSCSIVDGIIYAIGGIPAIENPPLSTVEAYDPGTNTWETKDSMPTPRANLSSCVVDSIIYAIGGSSLGIGLAINEAYDPVTNTWTTKTSMPNPRGYLSACAVDGIIYVFGGTPAILDGTVTSKVEAYNPKTDTWTEKAKMITGRAGLSACVVDGIIYAIGGAKAGFSICKTVEAYDSATDTWTTKADMPTARSGLSTTVVDGKIYAVGGATYGGGSGLSTVEVYEPVTDIWTTQKDMPTPRKYMSCSTVDGKIYAIGGIDDDGQGLATLEEYNPAYYTDIQAGGVSGIWTLAKSPYHINGEITVPNDSSLKIEPGVEVIFTGHYKFKVQGRLLAVGTKVDTIRFTADNKQTGWHGIRFENTPNTNDTSKMIYCSFKYGKANNGAFTGDDRRGGAIFINGFDKVLISNSLFESNMNNGDISSATGGAAIYVGNAKPIIANSTFLNNIGTTDCSILFWYSNGTISNNIFSNNSGPHGPVFCAYNSPTVSGNIISNNITTRAGGGIFCMTSSTNILNNIIVNNKCFGQEGEGGGIKCWINDKSKIINNTIVYNSGAHGGGICCNANADPIFINNIIWGNSSSDGSQVNLLDSQSDPHFLYCDIQDGKEGFRGSGTGSNYTGSYDNNINENPYFINESKDNYSLSDSSKCIGAGIDSIEISGTKYYCPSTCIMRNPRPNPAGTMPDIGACENPLSTPKPTDIKLELVYPMEFRLFQNYPNPFNPTTSIIYQLSAFSHVTLKIYDILGKEIATFVNEEKPLGRYNVTWNATNLPSGVYFYQLKAGDFIATKKLLLLK